jgi:hypothetical protein
MKAFRSALSRCLVGVIAIMCATGICEVVKARSEDSISTGFFPIGVFEDGNIINNAQNFRAMVMDLENHDMDTVLFVNNSVDIHAPLLSISDQLGFNIIFSPAGELNSQWWPESVPGDLDTAQRVIAPIVERLRDHPSLRAYNIIDEPDVELKDKVALAVQVFRDRDPLRPAMPTLIGLGRADLIFDAAQPDIMLIDVYPAGSYNAPCDFTMTGFGYSDVDFIQYVRAVTRSLPPSVPLWFILQTHGWHDPRDHALREPTVAEVRLQNWLAVGEGAKGIFWFIYSSEQGWRGLQDNPSLYREVTALARRVGPLRSTLLSLRKVEDEFFVASSVPAYASTLATADGAERFVVVANRDCTHAQMLSVRAPERQGSLRDLESGESFRLGMPIRVAPGDGRIFAFVPESTPASKVSADCPVGQYRAEYYDNPTLDGIPLVSRCENGLDHDWTVERPVLGVGPDNFSVRWRGRHDFSGGQYTFVAVVDDGVRLWLDDELLIDAWRDQPPTEYRSTRMLAPGTHEVRVEFYDREHGAAVHLSW